MAKLRSVDTHFWKDGFVIDLDPIEKLMFLYLLTNPSTTLAGCYEMSPRQAAFDTGIDKDMVIKILERFEAAGKLVYKDGWIVLLNFLKHQNLNTNMGKSAAKDLNGAPKWVSGAIVKGCGMVPEWFPNGSETIKGREENRREGEGEREDEKEEKRVEETTALQIHLGTILAGITKELELKKIAPGPQRLWINEATLAFENGFSANDFIDCFSLLRKQRGYAIKPEWVTENLPELGKLRAKAPMNGNSKPKVLTGRQHAAEVDRLEAQAREAQ